MPRTFAWKEKMGSHERMGQALRAFREEHGVTQKYMAKIIGCHQTAIGKAERGHPWKGGRKYIGSIELLEAMAWALGLDLSDLAARQRRGGAVMLSSLTAERNRRKVA